MQVNAYGPYRVSRSFTPLIVASKRRITNIGSISGVLAPPALNVYSMSKHAIEACTDSEGHAYTHDRDTLVKMLDEALVNARPNVAPAATP